LKLLGTLNKAVLRFQKRPQNALGAFYGTMKKSLVRLGGVLKHLWLFNQTPSMLGKNGLGHFLRA
jgi:hypothetical protein